MGKEGIMVLEAREDVASDEVEIKLTDIKGQAWRGQRSMLE